MNFFKVLAKAATFAWKHRVKIAEGLVIVLDVYKPQEKKK